MDLPDAGTVGVVVAAVGGTVAAGASLGSWLAAHRTGRATEALADIEAKRWHQQLTPEFEVRCQEIHTDRAELWVKLIGPAGLDRVDVLELSIRDDDVDRTPRIAGGPTVEQVKAQVWGPYRFVPTIDGADRNGRAVAPISLAAGASQRLELEKTRAPAWANDPHWWEQYADVPVRLGLVARHGDESWTVWRDIEVKRKT